MTTPSANRPLRITAVSYLNTKPLLYGLLNHPIASQIDLQLDIPSVCADKLEAGRVDMGLIPVAAIPNLSTPYLISDYCIGSEGAVKTVGIYADVPLEKLDTLYLDFHSRTSVALTKLLLRDHWALAPIILPAEEGFIERIGGRTGALVIGDRTIGLEEKHTYFYDLGQAWKDHTGLPFVFAAWISNRPLDPTFVAAFNEALAQGVAKVPELMYLLPSPDPSFDLEAYYTRHISYDLNYPKRLAMSRFLREVSDTLPNSLMESLAVR
jgi:chorismate dehydratase